MGLGFGIVGTGMISRFHVKAIADIEGAEFVACCTGLPDYVEGAHKLVEGTDATAHASLEEMLADPKVDVVTICTPSGVHMEPAVAAANAGKHVIVEKPLEITLDRCDQIIEACEKNKVVCSAIFPSRFHKASLTLKEAVDSGKFGRLTLGDAYVKWFRTQEYYDSGEWRGTWALDGGGALMNQAIHTVDLLTWLMGPVDSIIAHTATLAHERIEVEDVATAALRFKNGALGVIEATTAAFPGMLKRIEIHGSTGSAVIEEEDIKSWEFETMTAEDEKIAAEFAQLTKTGGGAADPAAIGHHAHAHQFRDVIKAIENGTKPTVDGIEGRRSVEIILAIYKAAETGAAVALPLKEDPVLKAKANSKQL